MRKTYSHAMRKYITAAVVSAALMLVCAAVLAVFDVDRYIAATTLFCTGTATVIYVALLAKSRRNTIVKYLKNITAGDADLSENLITSVPLPMAVCSVDGTIRWYNDRFSKVFGGKKFEHENLDDCIESLRWSDVLKYPNGKGVMETIGERTYSIRWQIMRDNMAPNRIGEHYSVFFYLRDMTRELQLMENYDNERVDIAAINIDNIDEFFQKSDDDTADLASLKVRNAVAAWAKIAEGVLKKTERDKYFVAFEHKNLQKCIDDNFSVIENVVKVAEEFKFPISISIGIGTGGSLCENEKSARYALDLALGRGGGQVCVKDDKEFKFYGGRKVEYERSTRIKARSVSAALSELIKNSDNVILMGHKNPDYDCFGAAVGLSRAARCMGVSAYIVHEKVAPAVEHMYRELCESGDYTAMFVDESEAVEEITKDTLVIVLDTHRNSMVPAPKVLERAEKVVVIDHHRRSTEFISPCSLVYHEPYASSTCEMVTELLEYMDTGTQVTKLEAQCLYTGILMDTKNFMLKTGVRTFEAASYLRKLGLDTVAVRRMFSSRLEDYIVKSHIVSESVIAADGVAVSHTEISHINIRQLASQAADEMLNLEGVSASVVVFKTNTGVGYCARSIGTVNVQLIMEKLGGGGHMTVAGASIDGVDIEGGIEAAKKAINEYISERN